MATAKIFPVTAVARSLVERHPNLPATLPLNLIEEVLNNATGRIAKEGGLCGLKIYIKQEGSFHFLKRSGARIVDDQITVRVDADGKLIINVGDHCLSPYTQPGAVALYEWLVRSAKRIKEGRPYGQPVECEFHKYNRPRSF